LGGEDDKFTPTKHLTPPPPTHTQQPARSGSYRHGGTTTIKRGGGPVDGLPNRFSYPRTSKMPVLRCLNKAQV